MAGTSNITGLESIIFADNASFDGTERGGAMTTNGQLWIGSTTSPHVKLGSITSPMGSVTIGYSSPNITLEASGSGGSGVYTHYIVNPDGTGDYLTIQAAIDAAALAVAVNPVILIAPSSYTENLVLKQNSASLVSLAQYSLPYTALNSGSNGLQNTVTIDGTLSFDTGITLANIYGISFITNNASPILPIAAGQTANIQNCTFNNSGGVDVAVTAGILYAWASNFVESTIETGAGGVYYNCSISQLTVDTSDIVCSFSIIQQLTIDSNSSATGDYNTIFGISGSTNNYNSNLLNFPSFIKSITDADSPYSPTILDGTILCDVSSAAITIYLPDSPIVGRIFVIKDKFGDAGTNNITVTTLGGTTTIDGATSQVINVNDGSLSIQGDGTNYYII